MNVYNNNIKTYYLKLAIIYCNIIDYVIIINNNNVISKKLSYD